MNPGPPGSRQCNKLRVSPATAAKVRQELAKGVFLPDNVLDATVDREGEHLMSSGRKKISFSCVPEISQLYLAAAHDFGASKYGKMNWREIPIKASDYLDAIRRHLTAWVSGDDIDPDSGIPTDPKSGLPHQACVMAGISILLDAEAFGSLDNDLAKTPQLTAELDRLATLKASWKERFAPVA